MAAELLEYIYVGTGTTSTRTAEGGPKVDVVSGGIVKSNLKPSYFLKNGFKLVDPNLAKNPKLLEARVNLASAEKKLKDEEKNTYGTEMTDEKLSLETRGIEELQSFLTEKGVEFHPRAGKDKLLKAARDFLENEVTIEGDEEAKEEVVENEETVIVENVVDEIETVEEEEK